VRAVLNRQQLLKGPLEFVSPIPRDYPDCFGDHLRLYKLVQLTEKLLWLLCSVLRDLALEEHVKTWICVYFHQPRVQLLVEQDVHA